MAKHERRYHVVVINDRTGEVIRMTASPVTHAEACTILSKFDVKREWLRKQLKARHSAEPLVMGVRNGQPEAAR